MNYIHSAIFCSILFTKQNLPIKGQRQEEVLQTFMQSMLLLRIIFRRVLIKEAIMVPMKERSFLFCLRGNVNFLLAQSYKTML